MSEPDPDAGSGEADARTPNENTTSSRDQGRAEPPRTPKRVGITTVSGPCLAGAAALTLLGLLLPR